MSTGAASSTAAMAFPLVAPQLATLGADSPLAGQQVLCLPDSVFVKGYEGEPIRRFAVTGLVTHEQYARFAESVQGKIFWWDIRPNGAIVVGDGFHQAAAKGIRAAFEYERARPSEKEVTEESLLVLLDSVRNKPRELAWDSFFKPVLSMRLACRLFATKR